MSFIKKCQDQYQELWQAIIRPPRDEYELEHLGPKKFKIENKQYKRTDITLKNYRNLKIQCSWFTPLEIVEPAPCVIYLHGNCSSRLEALPYLDLLLPLGMTLFCFDFAGSGKSDGEYISLGYYERYDIQSVINYLRSTNNVSTIGLWGRSMGAATALMFAEMDQSVGGIVVDSAFASLRQLAGELSKMYMKRLPGMFVSAGLKIVGVTIKKKAGFNVSELRPIAHVKKGQYINNNNFIIAFVPALFIAANDDSFIDPKHTVRLHKDYSGEKKLMMIDGDHNSTRPQEALDSIAIFFFNVLQCHQLNSGKKSVEFMNQQFQTLGLSNNNNKTSFQIDDNYYNQDDDDDYEEQMEEQWEDMEGFDQAELQLAIKESLKVTNQLEEEDEEDFFSSVLACSKNREKLESKINNQSRKNNESNNSDSNNEEDIFDFFDNNNNNNQKKKQTTIAQTATAGKKTNTPNQIEDFFNFSPHDDNKQQNQQQQEQKKEKIKQSQQQPVELFDLLSLDTEEQKQQQQPQQNIHNDYFEDSLI